MHLKRGLHGRRNRLRLMAGKKKDNESKSFFTTEHTEITEKYCLGTVTK